MKFVVLAVVVGLLGWLLFGRKRQPRSETKARTPAPRTKAAVTAMVACAHCGTHVPQAEALFNAQGQAFCCAEHLRAGAQPTDRNSS